MDLCDDPDSQTVTVRIEVAGVRPSDVEINLIDDDKLVVAGKRRMPENYCPSKFPVQEFEYGYFSRSIDIPRNLRVRFDWSVYRNKSWLNLNFSETRFGHIYIQRDPHALMAKVPTVTATNHRRSN
jgi:hypothetical protein